MSFLTAGSPSYPRYGALEVWRVGEGAVFCYLEAEGEEIITTPE